MTLEEHITCPDEVDGLCLPGDDLHPLVAMVTDDVDNELWTWLGALACAESLQHLLNVGISLDSMQDSYRGNTHRFTYMHIVHIIMPKIVSS